MYISIKVNVIGENIYKKNYMVEKRSFDLVYKKKPEQNWFFISKVISY
jgi:hypothetical protein